MANKISGETIIKYWIAYNEDKSVKLRGVCNPGTQFETGLLSMEVFDTKEEHDTRCLILDIKEYVKKDVKEYTNI